MAKARARKDTKGASVPLGETDSNDLLPKPEPLPGAVCAQYVRCGRPGCKCAKGELHGPYYYRFYRERGRQHKAYVRPSDLDAVRAACEARRARRRESREAMVEVKGYFRLLRLMERGDYGEAARILGVIHGR